MSSLPRYDWHYVYPARLIDEEADSIAHLVPKGTFLLLTLSTPATDHVIALCANHLQRSIEEHPAYSTVALNKKLHAALQKRGDIQQVLAAELLFLQQIRAGLWAEQLLETAAPPQRHPAVQEILAPSMGWLMWTWQLQTLLMTAGCTAPLAKEVAQAYRLLYPRTRRFLESLRIGDEALHEIVEKAASWKGTITNMVFPDHLLNIFDAGYANCQEVVPARQRDQTQQGDVS